MPTQVKAPRLVKGGIIGTLGAVTVAILMSVLSVEGGYVNDRNDPGGETNRGVTKAVARDSGFTGSMRDLTEAQALEIYAKKYIQGPGYSQIVEFDPAIAAELIDTGINAGPGRASRWLQQSLNHLNYRGRHWSDISVDGQIGPGTMRAYRSLQRRRGVKASCEILFKMLDAKQAAHYMRLGRNNSRFETFIFGWFKRVGAHGEKMVAMPDGTQMALPNCADAKRMG